MGFLVDTQREGVGSSWGCLRSLVRRKQVDSHHARAGGHNQLAKALTVPHLIAIGNSFLSSSCLLEWKFNLIFFFYLLFLAVWLSFV